MSKIMTTPELSAQEIISLVKQRLAPYQTADNALDVLSDVQHTHKEGRWWYVIVSSTDPNSADYNARVEKVERDLKKLDNAHVVLLPDIPEWMHNTQH